MKRTPEPKGLHPVSATILSVDSKKEALEKIRESVKTNDKVHPKTVDLVRELN